MRLLLVWGAVWAQAPEILRFIPGRYREGASHRIDLYNPTPQALSLGGWLLVTRDYSVRLPTSLVLAPWQRITIGKYEGDVRLDRYPDFLIRFWEESQPGAYVALLDDQGRFRRGIYLAPSPQVLFLPDSGVNVTREGRKIPFYLPSETASGWEYVPWEPDPIIGVVRIGGAWRYTISDVEREAHLYAPVRFPILVAAYEGGAVHLSWEVEGREPCDFYRIERSSSKSNWEVIAKVPCPSPGPGRHRMEHYDTQVREGYEYRYRLVYESLPSLRLESAAVSVRCEREQKPLQVAAEHGSLRLRVAQSQPLKIRLLDKDFTEQLRIYDGWVNGGVENLFVWDTLRVRNVKWIVIWTASRRYWIELPHGGGRRY